jgi:alpha-L-fucosidase 2
LLDLYNGELTERGNGLTARVYVQPHSDVIVIDVTGANPERPQSAQLGLWFPRKTQSMVSGKLGLLAETWKDDKDPGASGRKFGSLAALTVEATKVSIQRNGDLEVSASFFPDSTGHFRILVASPHYDGDVPPALAAARLLKEPDANAHRLWWNAFWHRAGLIKVSSADGWADYMENLRNIYLFTAAAENGGEYPGSQAGIADLFSAVKDTHQWDPAAFWHWNLRMQVAANMGAGIFEANEPYFNLYRENLANITAWTHQHMQGRPGICVPETMRFNGPGIEYESWDPAKPIVGLNCDAASKPYYNARTISTGAEASSWIWQQYLQTRDRAFLETNYPVMTAASRFLLDYEKKGQDGQMHTSPSNAHETQWDTTDPTTDLAARQTLFTATQEAAELLHRDASLVSELDAALKAIPPFPRTQESGTLGLLPQSADAESQDIIASSYNPGAPQHNVENIGLEPVWPYGLIGADSPLEAVARRTYMHRPYPTNQDWSFDPIQAARLGLPDEVQRTLVKLTQTYQKYPNGMASWGGSSGEFYIEQDAVVATALQEALAQDFDGTIRIARGVPAGWKMEGTVFLKNRMKVHVRTEGNVVRTLVVDAGDTGPVKLENPWPGIPVSIEEGGSIHPIINSSSAAILKMNLRSGKSYTIRPARELSTSYPAEVISGSSSEHARRIGNNSIGLTVETNKSQAKAR